MANIMLTYRCNLRCPYCFANEFVNHSKYDITLENFQKALDFIKTSPERHVGLIGGEPTIHGHFREFLKILEEDDGIKSVTIYTNGVEMDSWMDFLENPKFSVLVNCNSPDDIGPALFEKIQANLDRVFQIKDVWKRVNFGINLYKNSLDYNYIIHLLTRYHLHRVRMSVTVPNLDETKKANSLDYLRSRCEYILRFILDCADHDVAPYFDCNVIPRCVWTEEQLQQLNSVIEKFHLKNTNLTGEHSFCRPVIDILPDLKAVRCFGTSDFTKVYIRDFKNIDDLRNYYVNIVDCHVTCCMKEEVCRDCYERKVLQCTAGCLAFIRDKLMDEMSQYNK